MKILWYLLTFLFGAFGVLALVRSIERLVTGQGGSVQILIAFIILVLAWQCLRKARSAPPG